MEDWEYELEFEIHQQYDKSVRRASGLENDVEEVQVDEKSFTEDLKELMGNKYKPDEWEEVGNG